MIGDVFDHLRNSLGLFREENKKIRLNNEEEQTDFFQRTLRSLLDVNGYFFYRLKTALTFP